MGTVAQPNLGFSGAHPVSPQFGQPTNTVNGAGNVPNLYSGQPSGFGGFNANNANMSSPWMSAMSQGQPGQNQTNPWFTQLGSYGYGTPSGLNPQAAPSTYQAAVAQGYGPGASVDTTPAWQAMVQAQGFNTQQGADSLAEQFNNGGGLFSSAYGGAQGQYQSQVRLGQNAQLTQAQLQAMLAAQGYQNNAVNNLTSNGLQSQGLALQGAGLMNSMYNQNLLTGNTLGQSQLNNQQNALTAQYQNWYASQPYNNPLLSMLYSQSNAYPNYTPQTQTQGWLPGLLGGLGQAAQGYAGLQNAGVFGNSAPQASLGAQQSTIDPYSAAAAQPYDPNNGYTYAQPYVSSSVSYPTDPGLPQYGGPSSAYQNLMNQYYYGG